MNVPLPLQRTALRAPRAVVACLCLLVLAGCNANVFETGNTKAQDEAARLDYYQEAAKTYYDGGRYDASAKMWDKVLVETPEDQWAKFGLAKSLHMQGTPQSLRRAEAILKEIVSLGWQHPTRGDVGFEVKSTLANVYTSLADFYDRDIRAIEGRLENDQCADARPLEQQILCQKAKRDELLRASIPLWNDVLSCSTDNPSALAGLSKAHLIVGPEDLGIHYAEQYIRLSRESQVGWRQQLHEWQKTMGSKVTPEQRAFYRERIMGARDKEMGMHLLLGSVYMRREQFSKAVNEYDEVVAMDPAVPAAYVERAQAYAALGVYQNAIKDLERYLKMTDPEKQRRARVRAAELLDRYRLIAEGGTRAAPTRPVPTPSRSSASTLAPLPPSLPGIGSPDGDGTSAGPSYPPPRSDRGSLFRCGRLCSYVKESRRWFSRKGSRVCQRRR